MRILKIIDRWGWAYEFVGREYARYSRHEVSMCPLDEVGLARGDWDCIYIHGADIGENARATLPWLAKSLGIPVIGGYGGYNERTYEYADAICCIAPQSYRWTRQVYDCPVYFVTEGIDTNFWTTDPHRNYARPLIIGWAGRPASVKRPELLQRLCKRVQIQSDRDESLFVQDRDLSPMQDFYRSIDALILLSKSECMPRVILEAMASGLPVISTDVGNVREIVPSTCIITETEPDAIIECANRLIRDLETPQIREAIGIRNRLAVEDKVSWHRLAPHWDDMFEEVVSRCQSDCYTS